MPLTSYATSPLLSLCGWFNVTTRLRGRPAIARGRYSWISTVMDRVRDRVRLRDLAIADPNPRLHGILFNKA